MSNKREDREEFRDEMLASLAGSLASVERKLNETPKAQLLPPVARDPLADYDRLGRKQPTRMSFLHLVRAIPGLPGRLGRVPAAAIVEQGNDGIGEYSLVQCPCSAHPIVRPSIAKCDGCERYYVSYGVVVMVAYGEMNIPGAIADQA